MLDFIKGDGPKPDWYDDKTEKETPPPPEVPNKEPADKTMPIPTGDGPGDNHVSRLVNNIFNLVGDMEPEDVQEIFQIVFEKLPGVELSSPGDEDYPEEVPGTEYVPGAQGRPVAGFQLENLTELIREVLSETNWYNITSGERAPPHSTGAVEPQDQELIQRIQNAYHDLQDAFEELPDDIAQEMGRKIISDLETLMDTTEYPEDYRE